MTDEFILVCARVEGDLMLADNLVGNCGVCNCVVQHRPHATGFRELRCTDCAMALIQPDDEVILPDRMLDDAMAYFRKKLQ